MIVRIFAGRSWAAATVLDDAKFDTLPRNGEKLAIEREDGWAVTTVLEVAHRVTGDDAADVALLVSPVVQSARSEQALPFAALDGEEGAAPAAVPRVTKPNPWDR